MLVLGVVVAGYNLQGNPIHGSFHGGSAIATWLTSATVVFRYFGMLLLPIGLAPNYIVHLRDSLIDPAVLASLVGLAAIAGLTLRLLVKRRPEAFWILWFFIALLPMLNIIPFRSLMQDRYLYLPLIGAVGLVACLAPAGGPGLRRALAVAAVVAVAAQGALSFRQVEAWSDNESLWVAMAERVALPTGSRRYTGNDHSERLRLLRAAAERRPDSAVLQNNLGQLAYNDGRDEEALRLFQRALLIDASIPEAWFNQGRMQLMARRLDSARQSFERSRELDGYSLDTHLNLARIYIVQREPAAARAALDACGRIRPDLIEARYWSREEAALKRLEARPRGSRGSP
jgi:tetratricopeptide (TPR) repeat protein